MPAERPDLFTAATRLYAALLQEQADDPSRAVPDHRLTELCNLPHRVLIDAAHELLKRGVGVVAGSRGRWLTNDVDELRSYLDSLSGRAKAIFVRRRAVKACIAKIESATPPPGDPGAQLGLFPEPVKTQRPRGAGAFA